MEKVYVEEFEINDNNFVCFENYLPMLKEDFPCRLVYKLPNKNICIRAFACEEDAMIFVEKYDPALKNYAFIAMHAFNTEYRALNKNTNSSVSFFLEKMPGKEFTYIRPERNDYYTGTHVRILDEEKFLNLGK